jgi:hypothetical protein
MKQKLFLFITLAIACSFITKPFAFVISSIDPKTGLAKAPLEKSTAVIQTKGKISATTSSYTISNAKSTVRIKINDAVFQSDNLNSYLSANDNISLYKLSIGKSRSFVINTDGTTNAALIPINFIPGEQRSHTRITPVQAFIAGEYAFIDMSSKTADGNITVWTFGIDN